MDCTEKKNLETGAIFLIEQIGGLKTHLKAETDSKENYRKWWESELENNKKSKAEIERLDRLQNQLEKGILELEKKLEAKEQPKTSKVKNIEAKLKVYERLEADLRESILNTNLSNDSKIENALQYLTNLGKDIQKLNN